MPCCMAGENRSKMLQLNFMGALSPLLGAMSHCRKKYVKNFIVILWGHKARENRLTWYSTCFMGSQRPFHCAMFHGGGERLIMLKMFKMGSPIPLPMPGCMAWENRLKKWLYFVGSQSPMPCAMMYGQGEWSKDLWLQSPMPRAMLYGRGLSV
jgi:hypothetical protein